MSLKQLHSFFRDFCSEHPTTEKICIVPSFRIGHQIGESLAAQGVSWINLRFVTLFALGQEAAGAEMAAQGLRQISGAASLFLVEKIFRQQKSEGKLKYFDALEPSTGVVKSVLRSIQALRMAGLSAQSLTPDSFVNEQKGREVIQFLRGYELELKQQNSLDTAGLFQLAAQLQRDLPPLSRSKNQERFFLCLQTEVFRRVEEDFLAELVGKDLVLVPRSKVLGLERPQNYYRKSFDIEYECPESATDLQRMPWLFAPDDAPPAFKDGTISLFNTIGTTSECREVFRRIIQSKNPLDEVEVIHPPGACYPALFHVIAAKTGLNVTFAQGIPLDFTAPGKVFSGLLDWLENDFLTTALCRMIENGSLKLSAAKSEERPSAVQATRYLRNAMIGWGRARYIPRLKSLKESVQNRAELALSEGEPEKSDRYKTAAREIAWLEGIILIFFKYFPEHEKSGLLDLGKLCLGLSRFLKKQTHIRSELDAEALGILTARLTEAGRASQSKVDSHQAYEWLRSLKAGLCAGASGPRPGHLHLADFTHGGYSGRPVTFVVGLDQGVFPGTGLQDPILLDEERENISDALPTALVELKGNLYSMASLLSSLRGRLILSYSAFDIVDERPSFPSSLLLQAFRLKHGRSDLDYTDLITAIPESSGILPGGLDRVLDEIDWWLAKLVPGGRFLEGRAAVLAHFSELDSGVAAVLARESELLSEYDGQVDLNPKEFHPSYNPTITVSATRLELLATCPFAYFLNYILVVSKPDELEYDQTRWLDPMQRGTLLHEIFCVFMRKLRDSKEHVDPEKHRALLEEIAEECIQGTREKIPPPTEGIFQRERRELYESLYVFLCTEKKRSQSGEPVLFEAGFGLKKQDGEGIEQAVEIQVDADKSVRLGGKIDRVDRIAPHAYRVIDYKSGSYFPYEDIVCFNRGRTLQHVLYGRAAGHILKAKDMDASPQVVESGYVFPTRRGEGREILFKQTCGTGLESLLNELLSILEQGNFLVHPEARCDFCDYLPVCGKEATSRSKTKRMCNPDAYGVFDRLKEYE